MSQLLERNIIFLESLNKASPEDAKLIIEQASEDNILALTELAVNILRGKLEIGLESYVKLKVHSDLIRKLAKKSVSVKNKRKWLVRSIEVLPLIITPLVSCLGSCLLRKFVEGSTC